MEEILVDTTGLWGLTYKDSKFHSFMKNLAKQKKIIIPATQILELLIVAYREKSSHGKSLKEGIQQIQHIFNFYSNIEKLKPPDINIKFHPVEGLDIIEAAELILIHLNNFIRKGPRETKWLEFIDAITAAIWRKTKLTLYTADQKLKKFGDKHQLQYETIKPE